MSVPEIPPSKTPPPVPAPKQGLGGCAMVFLILVGVVLLLPGLCSLIFAGIWASSGGGGGDFIGLWLITFAIAAGGIALIRHAVRNR